MGHNLHHYLYVLLFLVLFIPVSNDLGFNNPDNFRFFKNGLVVEIDRTSPPLVLLKDENMPSINNIYSDLKVRPINITNERVDNTLDMLKSNSSFYQKSAALSGNSKDYFVPVSNDFVKDWNEFQIGIKNDWNKFQQMAYQNHGEQNAGIKQKWVSDNVWVGLPGQRPKARVKAEDDRVDVMLSNLVKSSESKPNNISDEFNQRVKRVLASNNIDKPNVEPDTDGIRFNSKINVKNLARVGGNITLQEGLAFLGGTNNLKVFQLAGGLVVSEGVIDNRYGTYLIDIKDNHNSMLVAELRDDTDALIGYTEYLLDEVQENFDIYVEPVDRGFVSNIYSMDIDGSTSPFSDDVHVLGLGDNIKMEVNGVYSIPKLSGGSSFLSLLDIGNWKTFFWSSNNTSHMTVPGPSVLKSLSEFAGDVDIRKNGIIWGCLPNNRQRVEIQLADPDVNGPLYLDDEGKFIRSEAGSVGTGCFAYYDVPQGVHLLRAKMDGSVTNVKVLDVLEGHITSLDISDGNMGAKRIVIIDKETGEILDSDLSYIGSDEVLSTNNDGYADIRFIKSNEPLHVEVRPHSVTYNPVRITTNSNNNRSFVNVTVPSKQWLGKIASYSRVTDHPNLSMVVSYIQGSEIDTSGNLLNKHSQIVFFDKNLEPVEAEDDYVSGFVIFNVNPGIHSIKYIDDYGNITIKTFIADPDYISVLSNI